MQHYRYTHTRYTADKGTVLAHDVGTASGLTAEEVKHRIIGRFALQAWNSWICCTRWHAPADTRLDSPMPLYRFTYLETPARGLGDL